MTPYVVILCAALNLMISVASIDQSAIQTEKSLASDSKTLASPRFKEQTTDAVAIAAMILAIPDLKTLSGNPWVTPAEDPNDAARPNWCTFKGVTCFTDGCKKKAYVSAISLAGLSLAGSLPSEIGHFSKLTSFDMKGNRLTKKIPSSIGMLSSITSLSLAGNAITGTVPDVLTKMTSLVSLDLSSNRFNGDPFPATLSELRLLPAFINTLPSSIGLLSSLTYLNISNSLLIGSIPTSVSNLKNLVAFSLSKNSLTGTIPDSISDLTNLQALDLSSNSFEGVFPPRLKQLTRLTSIKVTNNFLTSAREDFRLTFANMPQIPVGDIIESYCNNCYLVFVAGSITYCNIRNGCLLPGKPTFAPTILDLDGVYGPVSYTDDEEAEEEEESSPPVA